MDSDSDTSTPKAPATDLLKNVITEGASPDQNAEEFLNNLLQKLEIEIDKEATKLDEQGHKKSDLDIDEVEKKELASDKEEKPKIPALIQRCYIVDDTPHIVQTKLGYHVLIQQNEDQSLYIYKPNGDIVKSAPWYRNGTLDVNKVLSDHWIRSEKHPDWRNHMKLLSQTDREELREQIGKLLLELPEEKATTKETQSEIELNFTNFSLPTRQTLECWFHPSNIWHESYPKTYFCYGYEMEVHISGQYTRNGPAFVSTPIEIFSQPKQKTKIGYNIILDRKPLVSEVVKLITIFETAKNNPRYRCRLDIDDRDSSFWVDKPLMRRIMDCVTYPHSQISLKSGELIDLSQLVESQIQHTKIRFDKIYNGLNLLDNIVDQNQKIIDLSGQFLKNLTWTELHDEQANARGYLYMSSFDKYVIYKNVFRFDLHTIRSDECQFEYNIYHNGTIPVCCTPNFDPVETGNKPLSKPLWVYLKSKVYDVTPTTLHSDSVDEWIDLDTDNIKKEFKYTNDATSSDWQPAVIQCCSTCKVPDCAVNRFDRWSKKFRRMRKIEVPNEVLDKCLWMPVNTKTYDGQHFDGEWKQTKLDKIPIFKCFNARPKHQCSEDEQGSDFTVLLTYSRARGLSGLDPLHFELCDEGTALNDRENTTTWIPPATPCEPGCHIPTEILNIRLTYTEDLTKWYKDFSLKQHILNHQPWHSTYFPCTSTYSHSWEMIIFEKRPVFRCHNSIFVLPMTLPVTSEKRWTIAYCFAESQFKRIRWKQEQHGHGYSLRIHKATINIPSLNSNQYTVTLDNGKSCTYLFNHNRIGTPSAPPLFLDRMPQTVFDDEPTHIPLTLDNYLVSEDYLREQTHFNKSDEAFDYNTAMSILRSRRLAQGISPETMKIISTIPAMARSDRRTNYRETSPAPSFQSGADRLTKREMRQKKMRRVKSSMTLSSSNSKNPYNETE